MSLARAAHPPRGERLAGLGWVHAASWVRNKVAKAWFLGTDEPPEPRLGIRCRSLRITRKLCCHRHAMRQRECHISQARGQPRPDPMLQLSKFSKMRLAFPAAAASPFCTKACPRDLRARPLLDSLAIPLVAALYICKGSQCDLEFAEKVIQRRESLLHMDGQTMSECMAAHCKTP